MRGLTADAGETYAALSIPVSSVGAVSASRAAEHRQSSGRWLRRRHAALLHRTDSSEDQACLAEQRHVVGCRHQNPRSCMGIQLLYVVSILREGRFETR